MITIGCGRVGFDTVSSGCLSVGGPTMVAVAGFCIDSTEVTNQQYVDFLAAKAGDTSNQPAPCTGNDFTPSSSWPPPVDEASSPVVYVDWCDARAFCAWAGKRLCGKIGGGSVSDTDWALPDVDEWTYACSHAGTYAYPYGDSFDAGACNVNETGIGHSVSVGSMSRCAGGFPGIYDMSGNVFEWEDACDDTRCTARGGSYGDDLASGRLGCVSGRSFVQIGNSYSLDGFRCCADP